MPRHVVSAKHDALLSEAYIYPIYQEMTTDDTFYLPAEWQPQSGIQLTWPHQETDWHPYLDDIQHTYIELAKAITTHELLLVVAPQTEPIRQQLEVHLDATHCARIRYCACPTNDTWARDHGALTLMGQPHPQLLDFRFNGWGEKFEAGFDNAITRHLCAQQILHGTYEDCNDFVLEGGSIESDGQGTILTTSHCLLAPHRNQPLTRDALTQQLLNRFHAKRILWLDHGTLEGDDTDGHIDTTVRFAPNDTLLYISCNNPADSHYADFQALEQQLHTLRTLEGKPYQLIPLPFPDPIYYEGERLPASYANFLVINGAVIYPTYNQPHNDRLACEALQRAFPDREMLPVDSRIIIRQHGSIHCLTMQYPTGVLR